MPSLSRAKIDSLIRACSNWDAFSDLAKQSTKKDKGDLFERLTQLYLETRPEYRTILKSVWINSRDTIPDRVRKATRLPILDEGIDLIAETKSGEYWAIQSKFRSNKNEALTTGVLSKFTSLAFVTCRNIALGVVVHTSAKPVMKKHLLGKTTEIGLERWLDIAPEDWEAIRKATKGQTARPKARQPRRHQVEAIKAAQKHFGKNKSSRGRLIMPCGTGKSLTAFWIAEALKVKTILIAVPSLALIKQGLGDWTREYLAHGVTPEWLCVCGDETVGATDKDEFVASTYDTGIPTTTDTKEIISFLKKPSRQTKIVFTTYQSSHRLAAATRRARTSFDLAILDEAHKTVGVKSKRFATLLFDNKVRVKKRLFMTATERVLRGSNDDVLSMSDSKLYGECFHQLTFKKAIQDKIISDYKILTVSVSNDHIKSLIKENRLLTNTSGKTGEHEAQLLAAGIALMRTYRRHSVHHAISFHRSIKSADDFREQQDRMNGIRSLGVRATNLHISSHKSAGERAGLLKDFANYRRALMTNARCLTEGVDIPAIDAVLFADPKQSTVDIVQAAGRALRRYAGKEFGYILLPLVVPAGQDVDEFAETTAFKQIAKTIAALSTQDERIAEEFRAVTQGKRTKGKIVEIAGDVPVGMKIDFGEFADAISTKVWEKVGRANWRPFKQARAFARKLKLKSEAEWRSCTKTGKLPSDVPADPGQAYEGKGWAGMGDWLGTGTVATHLRKYRPFKQARAFARKLNLKSRTEWSAYARSGKLPADVPADPGQAYEGKGWAGMGDWLGTGTVATHLRKYRPFEQARAFARKLNLKSETEWRAYTKSGKLPADIPANPNKTYKGKGWAGMGDWLGTGTVATYLRKYRPFKQARAFARKLDLKSQTEWLAYTKSGKLPADIPADPSQTYEGKGWSGFGDWFGTGTVATHLRKYRSLRQARVFARKLNLKSRTEWSAYTKSGKLPADVPAAPHHTYSGKGWAGMADWLGKN